MSKKSLRDAVLVVKARHCVSVGERDSLDDYENLEHRVRDE